VIGNEEDDNYQANISIVDDDDDGGEVVLNFNTFTAGDTNTSVDVVTAEGDDEATLVNQDSTAQGLSSLLDTGDYDISVSRPPSTARTRRLHSRMRATSGRSSSASAPRTTCSSGAPPQTCATTLLTCRATKTPAPQSALSPAASRTAS